MKHNPTNLLTLARNISEFSHKGMKYGTLDYFNYHVQGVVNLLSLHGYSEEYLIVGYLHDVVEDTSIDIGTIYNIFGGNIGEAVQAITKIEGEPLQEYYQRCRSNPIAKAVKLQDLSFNLTNCLKNKNKEKFKYYSRLFYNLNKGV